jgi:hypothetical protein
MNPRQPSVFRTTRIARALALAACAALVLAAAPARAGDEFDRAFKYELGRIAAHSAVHAGAHIVGAVVGYPHPPVYRVPPRVIHVPHYVSYGPPPYYYAGYADSDSDSDSDYYGHPYKYKYKYKYKSKHHHHHHRHRHYHGCGH